MEPKDLEYLLSSIRGRISRIDYFSPNTVTCVIVNDEERDRLLRVPGRENPSSPKKMAGQRLLERLWEAKIKGHNEHWVNGVLRFFESQKQNLPHQI